MRACHKRIDLLTDAEFKVLQGLTLDAFGGCGSMRPKLVREYNFCKVWAGNPGIDPPEVWATYIRQDGMIIGWALTFRPFYPTRPAWVRDSSRSYTYEAYFFVHPKHRQSGIGRHLYRAVTRKFGKPKTSPWDHTSRQFFTKVGAAK